MTHGQIAIEAAKKWGFDADELTLAAHRENIVYRAATPTGDYALRLHRPGYRTKAELRSELHWMAAIHAAGISVPRPIAAQSGALVCEVDHTLIDVLTWLPGRPIGAKGVLHKIADPANLVRQLGQTMSKIHSITDGWTPPPDFTRPAWDRAGLLGDTPLWGQFWTHPNLTPSERDLLERARAAADDHLARIEPDLDFGLIHADMITENLLINDSTLSVIDFDDGGYGFRAFDVVTFLFRFRGSDQFETLKTALLDGYSTRARLDEETFDLFMLLRAFTYVGWIKDRMEIPASAERSALAIATASTLARRYLNRLG